MLTKSRIVSPLFSVCIFSLILQISAMNFARVETRVDLAVSTFGVTGEGVIVAIIDRGIDWTNNDFRNDDGTTRIKYIFDLMDNTGANAPGNTYGVGTIYTEAQINAALSGGPALATRDAVGHGSSTAGIATGNGRNLPDRRYRGVAPKASIIAVKFTSEGAPAHDGQPAEAPFFDGNLITHAINFVRDKSNELDMPAVMLANFGSPNGPNDGTSFFSRTVDAAVGPGKPGLVFVCGTGDAGGVANRAGGTVTQGGTSSIQIQKTNAGLLRFDLWYGGNDRFEVSLQTPNGNFGPYAPPNNGIRQSISNSTFTFHHNGAGNSIVFYGAQNGKREIFIDIVGPAGTYNIQLTGQTVVNGRFDATINPSHIPAPTSIFQTFGSNGAIVDVSTPFNNVAPNSYVIRNNWTDIDGVPRSITGQGNPGELWLGSSIGPTFDGRLGVDVSAPGDLVMTTYSQTSYWNTFRFNKVNDGAGFYGRAGAVSAAAPQVTGMIALMLEQDPTLDASQIKQILKETARSDSFTGTTPNVSWGGGKVDAYEAVRLAGGVTVSGRITTAGGRGIAKVLVSLTDSEGSRVTAYTNSFGYFSFFGVQPMENYEIAAKSRRYQFANSPHEIFVTDDVSNENFQQAAPGIRSEGPSESPLGRKVL